MPWQEKPERKKYKKEYIIKKGKNMNFGYQEIQIINSQSNK